MLGSQTCMDCGRVSPENSGEATLTTSLGWRLRKMVDPAGVTHIEWRCPSCWARFKALHRTASGEIASVLPPSSGPKDPKGGR